MILTLLLLIFFLYKVRNDFKLLWLDFLLFSVMISTMKLTTWIRKNAKRHHTFKRGRTDINAQLINLKSFKITVLKGNEAPFTCGFPYWKTGFTQGNFHKTLYTPSTFKLCVGKEWIDNCDTIEEWCRKSKESPYNKD